MKTLGTAESGLVSLLESSTQISGGAFEKDKGHENTSLAFGPKENVRVKRAKGEVWRVADPNNINRVRAGLVMHPNCLPQSPTQVLIQQIA
jgi:hypothetical protein